MFHPKIWALDAQSTSISAWLIAEVLRGGWRSCSWIIATKGSRKVTVLSPPAHQLQEDEDRFISVFFFLNCAIRDLVHQKIILCFGTGVLA